MINKMLVKAVVTGGLLAGFFQMPTAPPMKLGLWETTSSTTMQMPGMEMAGADDEGTELRDSRVVEKGVWVGAAE